MERSSIFIGLLFVVFVILCALALPLLFPPNSIVECNKIIDRYQHMDCITAVAKIKNDMTLCQYSPDLYSCQDDFKSSPNPMSIKFTEKVYPDSLDDYIYGVDKPNHTEICAINGFGQDQYDYSSPYVDRFTIYEYHFLGDCQDILKNVSEGICREISTYKQERETCIKNIRMAKGMDLSQTCGSDYDCADEFAVFNNKQDVCENSQCFLTFALKNNNSNICSSVHGYDQEDCEIYFAFQRSDSTYCLGTGRKIEYCRAVLIAEEEANLKTQ